MSARLAVLGLLVEEPRHGYALDRVIEERGMRRWTSIGFSSIYWVLDRLVADGLAEVHEVRTSGRAGGRKAYRATAAGAVYWRDECVATLADFGRPVEAFLIALSGLPGLDQAAARRALEARLATIDARLADMAADRDRAGPTVPEHVEEMFSFGQALLEAQRRWLAGFLAERWPTDGRRSQGGRLTQQQQEVLS
jgi:DNA-binding PadR family transcriptional regulator